MKILIVDDSTNWRRFHRNNLKYLGINDSDITSADCAYDALSKIETSIDNPYDVILTDLQMESNFLPKLAGEWRNNHLRRAPRDRRFFVGIHFENDRIFGIIP